METIITRYGRPAIRSDCDVRTGKLTGFVRLQEKRKKKTYNCLLSTFTESVTIFINIRVA